MTDVIPSSSEYDYQQQQERLAAAKDVMTGPAPVIADPPDCMVTLPRGLNVNGALQNRAEVRELTGVDEEALAKVRRPEELFDTVLSRGVVRIGQLDLSAQPIGDRQGWLSQLLIGERDMLFLAIARATYGNERSFPVTCDRCQVQQEMAVNLAEDFPPRQIENARQQVFKFVSSKGLNIEFRLATGADQNEVLRKDGASVAEMNTMMLTNCITTVNGEIVVDPLNFARGLPMRDRQTLIQAMVTNQPTVDLSVAVPCSSCGEEIRVNFGWLDFFRP